MTSIFNKNITYSEDLLYLYAQLYTLELTDCLKDDGEITIATEQEGEPIWIFEIDEKSTLKLMWQKNEYLSNK